MPGAGLSLGAGLSPGAGARLLCPIACLVVVSGWSILLFAHLHVRSCFSFRAGGSTPESLAREAAREGFSALALTDRHGVFGAVRHQEACQAYGLKPIFGTALDLALGKGANGLDATEGSRAPEGLALDEAEPIGELVFLARDDAGYQAINRLTTRAHARSRLSPHILVSDLEAAAADLCGHVFVLTGGRDGALGRLLDDSHPAGRSAMARRLLQRLQALFGRSCLVELTHQLRPGDGPLLRRLMRLAEATGAPTVATGDVRYATRAAHARYDLLTCIREGTTVFERHPARPVNSQAYLQSEAILRKLISDAGAFDRAAAIAGDCTVDLLPGAITPPPSKLTRIRPAVSTSTRPTLRCGNSQGIRCRIATRAIRASKHGLSSTANWRSFGIWTSLTSSS